MPGEDVARMTKSPILRNSDVESICPRSEDLAGHRTRDTTRSSRKQTGIACGRRRVETKTAMSGRGSGARQAPALGLDVCVTGATRFGRFLTAGDPDGRGGQINDSRRLVFPLFPFLVHYGFQVFLIRHTNKFNQGFPYPVFPYSGFLRTRRMSRYPVSASGPDRLLWPGWVFFLAAGNQPGGQDGGDARHEKGQ